MEALRGRRQRTTRERAAIVAVTLVTASLAYVGLTHVLESDEMPALSRIETRIVTGEDRLPSSTAEDWVTYADYVVIATPVKESEIGPEKGEVEIGEGAILRSIEMRVDRILWGTSSPATPAPTSFSWAGVGWTFNGGVDSRTLMVAGNQPRVQTGHSYILAIDWEPDPCTDGSRGRWRGLGGDSVLPYDEGKIGVGEYEGRERTLDEASTDARKRKESAERTETDMPVSALLVGANADELEQVLNDQKPGKSEQFAPVELSCDD